jgi:hypothetical protein
MARKKTGQNISDEDAADALYNGSKSGSVPTHSSMQDAADDEEPDPNGDWGDDEWEAYNEQQGN